MIVAYLIPANGAEVSGTTNPIEVIVTGAVVLYGKAVRACIEIDAEPAVVGGIRSRIRCTDHVAADNRPGLVRQRVDATCVVELSGVVADFVANDAVVLHARIVWCPAPADADAGVADAVHEVAADGAVAYITQRNGYGSPVLVGDIDDGVFIDGQPLTALGQVGIGTMYLARTLCKGTAHDGRAANVTRREAGIFYMGFIWNHLNFNSPGDQKTN